MLSARAAEISIIPEALTEEDLCFAWDEVGLPEESDLQDWQLEEITACALDCRYFIENFCWIERRETRQILPFVPYDYQWDILERLQNNESLVLNKSRRVGVSWIVAAYVAWLINFHEGANVLFLSRTENDAKELLRKVKFILKNLVFHDNDYIREATPAAWLRGEIEVDRQQYFSTKYLDDEGNTVGVSVVESLTMTIDAGRSKDATLVFWDEAAFAKPDDEATCSSLMPTATRGGQIVVVSTPNGVGGVFWQLVRAGERGDKNLWYHYDFIHWSEADITPEQVQRVRDALNMTNEMYLQEFEGQFLQPGTRVFDATYLDACYRPLDQFIDVWEYLNQYDQNDGFYYTAADSATGAYYKKRAPDENAFIALTRHGVTAFIEHNRNLLGDWAGKPVTGSDGTTHWQVGQVSLLHKEWPGILYIERFGPGDTVVNGYSSPQDSISQMVPVNPDQKSMPRIMEQLILAVEGNQLIITDPALYQQMYDIQRGHRPGTYEPPTGGNDDLVKCLAWAYDALLTHGGRELPEGLRLPDPNRMTVTGQFTQTIPAFLPGLSNPLNWQHLRQADMIKGPGAIPLPPLNAPVPLHDIDWMRPMNYDELMRIRRR